MANNPENTPQEILDTSLEQKKQDTLDRLRSATQDLGEKFESLRIDTGDSISNVPEAPIQPLSDAGDVLKGEADKATDAGFRKELKNFSEAVTTTIVGLHIEHNRLKVQTKKLLVGIIVLALAVLGIGIFSLLR